MVLIKGLYTAGAAMKAAERQSSITSNNLANANTAGFKKSESLKRSFPEMMLQKIEAGKENREIGSISSGVFTERKFKDMTQGDLRKTGNKLDLSIQGDGFFAVQTSDGIRYTRSGNFTLNRNSEIVTQSGYPLLDTDGEPVQTIPEREFYINGQGQLSFSGGLEGAEIAVVNFPEEQNLIQQGDNLYAPADENEMPAATDAVILQGYLENSNVEIVKEMVNMIKTTRHYEAGQKVISSIDDSLGKAINEVGKA
ncbi:MAG: flagellar basal-body rod protein FlgF [Bacillota bacterium]